MVGSLATLMLLGLLAGLYSVIRVSANKPLADVLVEDLQAVWSGRNPLTISTDDPDEVGRWIRQTAGWDVAVTSPAESARLLGARSCELNGRRAIFVLYDVQKQPVSLVVLSDALTELAGMKPMHARSDCYVDRCKGYTVVAVRRGGLAHVAVGRLPEEQLMRLLDVPVDTKL
ncbi:MAG: hypothetical protein GC162_00500 [Planctomycetes bacterium]|nr:hypothetical protein [Planctomycetota bacterium]